MKQLLISLGIFSVFGLAGCAWLDAFLTDASNTVNDTNLDEQTQQALGIFFPMATGVVGIALEWLRGYSARKKAKALVSLVSGIDATKASVPELATAFTNSKGILNSTIGPVALKVIDKLRV